jgi:hypothetical protein
VADIRLTAAPLSGGGDIDIAGNRIIARDDLALVSVATPLQGDAALKKVLTAEFGLKMPSATLSSMAKGVRAVSMAPDAMLLIFAHPTPDAEMHVRAKLGGAGYTTDQTIQCWQSRCPGPTQWQPWNGFVRWICIPTALARTPLDVRSWSIWPRPLSRLAMRIFCF